MKPSTDSTRRRRWRRRYLLAVGVVAALGFLTAGLWEAYDTRALSTRGVVASAVVEDKTGGTRPNILVSFSAGGRRIEGTTSHYEEPVTVGATVRVLYDPDNPDRFQTADWGTDYLAPALLIAGSVLTGLYTAAFARRRR